MHQVLFVLSHTIIVAGATGYIIDNCIDPTLSYIFPTGVCSIFSNANVIYAVNITDSTVDRIGMYYGANDFNCTGPVMDVRIRSSEPKNCSSFTTTQPAGLLNTASFGDSFGLNDGCGRPAYLFGYINEGKDAIKSSTLCYP